VNTLLAFFDLSVTSLPWVISFDAEGVSVLGLIPTRRFQVSIKSGQVQVVHRVEFAPDCMPVALYGRVVALSPVCAQEQVAH